MKKKLFVMLCICVLALSGCTEKVPENLLAAEITAQTLYLRSDGSIQSAYYEEFGKDNYSEGELRTFMEGMIGNYNKQNEGKTAELTEMSVTNGMITAVMTYESAEACSLFDQCYGSGSEVPLVEAFVAEDVKEQYGGMNFYQANSDKGTVSGDKALNGKKSRLAVVRGPVLVKTSGNITYFTSGTLLDEKTLKLEEETAVIVYKK